MKYLEYLKESSELFDSIVCMGADPVLERIPVEGEIEEKIVKFYSDIIDACIEENVMPSAIKPNYAFYAQYGFQGLRALKKVIEKSKEAGIPVIFDGKRGDIGKTCTAYAIEIFEFWGADAVTLSPFMGYDSIEPFVNFCKNKGKGVYVLNRTSNKSAGDFQDLEINGEKLFLKVSEKIVEWNKTANGGIGAVVGATSIQEFGDVCKYYSKNAEIPLLIPGVGSQGGSAEEVVKVLKENNLELKVQRINSSSGINYAYEKDGTTDYAGAAVKAIEKLNKEIMGNQ